MLIVGLTGGIGSGKTTVAKLFEALNIPVYNSDTEAKKLMTKSKIIQRRLIKKFGDNVYKDNTLNKEYLASIIFNDKNALKYISEIVHPKVAQHFKRWIKKQKSPFVIQENAIIFENKSENNFDKIITVTAPLKTKIERVIKRDNTTKKQVQSRIKNQLSDDEKIKKSDYVIYNLEIDKTKKQVQNIYEKLLNLSKKTQH
jgi:dephospho-CoA kinase